MEELQEKIKALTANEEARYFYHFTSGDGSKILEEGLIVANPLWEQSFLEFTIDEINNIASVINDNKSTQTKENNFMIIAGVYKDAMHEFIRRLEDDEVIDIEFEGVGAPDYIVDNHHLMGYVDLNSLELTINEYANVIGDDIYL